MLVSFDPVDHLAGNCRHDTFVKPLGEIGTKVIIIIIVLTDRRCRDLHHANVTDLDGSRIAYTVVNESSDWQTWTVPILGGEPRRFLTNAEGLNWIPAGTSSPRILFSELIGEFTAELLPACVSLGMNRRKLICHLAGVFMGS